MSDFFLYHMLCKKPESIDSRNLQTTSGHEYSLKDYQVHFSYFVISSIPILDIFLKQDLQLEKFKNQAIFIRTVSEHFDIDGVEEYYQQSKYFMKEFASMTEDLLDFRIFPALNHHPIENIHSWKSLIPYIDLQQIEKVKVTLLYKIEEAKRNFDAKKRRVMNIVNNMNDTNTPNTLNSINNMNRLDMNDYIVELEKHLSELFRDTIVRLPTHASISKHVIASEIHYNYDFSTVLPIYEESLHLDRQLKINMNQPVVFAYFDISKIKQVDPFPFFPSEAYITFIKTPTFVTIKFLSAIIRFQFQATQAFEHCASLLKRLHIPHECNYKYMSAFTHVNISSYMPSLIKNYESLEFLGDSLLSLTIGEFLARYQSESLPINDISQIYQNHVKNNTLMEIGERLNVNLAIWTSPFVNNSKVVSDVVEAMIGAMFATSAKSIQGNSVTVIDLKPIKDFCWRFIYSCENEVPNFSGIPINYIEHGLAKVEEKLGYTFKNKWYLIQALANPRSKDTIQSTKSHFQSIVDTARTFSFVFSNSTLSWLGSIVRMVVFSCNFFMKNPNLPPESMDNFVHSVQKKGLSQSLIDILKGEPFKMDIQTVESTKQLQNALLGAIYLDDPNLYYIDDVIDVRNKFVRETNDFDTNMDRVKSSLNWD